MIFGRWILFQEVYSDNGDSEYHNAGTFGTSTVSVALTLTDPGGVGHPLNLSQPINVWAPTAAAYYSPPDSNQYQSESNFVVNAIGVLDGVTSVGADGGTGIEFMLSAKTPALFLPEGNGVTSCAQLTNYAYWSNGFVGDSTNGQFWLDNQYPDGETGTGAPAPNVSNIDFVDSPNDGGIVGDSIQAQCSFETFLLYTPPANGGNVLPVPIFEVDWDWNAEADQTLPNAATASGGTTIDSAHYTTNFPAWSNIYTNSGGG